MQSIRQFFFTLFLAGAACSASAHDNDTDIAVNHDKNEAGGFLTEMANQAMVRAMRLEPTKDTLNYSRHEKRWASAPVLGAYYNGGYKYSDEDGKHGGPGFCNRLLRVYVNGTVLRHFAYRMQLEFMGSPHLKDAFIEYQQFTEARLKVGQFKRPFGFENPMNPWDVGVADYSQLTKKMTGFSDHTAAEYNGSNGGRDLGVQLQGDLLPVKWGGERHALIHYQGGVFNGQGINTTDANGGKDLIGTVQLQPVKNLFLGVFAWKGSYCKDGLTAEKRRWAAGVKYDYKDWSLRAEYAMHRGRTWSDLKALQDGTATTLGNRAQAMYVTFGAPITPWLKLYAKWDSYTADNNWNHRRDIYSLCPNLQPHRNLLLQLQWNIVRSAQANAHHELWAMAYVRI